MSQSPTRAGQESEAWPIRRMGHIVDRHLANISRALRPHGITAPMWRVLNGLEELEHPTIADLAEHAAFERSYVSRLVSRMQTMGLVVSVQGTLDRRSRAVDITPQGRALRNKALLIVRQQNDAALAGFSTDDQQHLSDYLDRIAHNVARPKSRASRV